VGLLPLQPVLQVARGHLANGPEGAQELCGQVQVTGKRLDGVNRAAIALELLAPGQDSRGQRRGGPQAWYGRHGRRGGGRHFRRRR
jgi:hypothetical protein